MRNILDDFAKSVDKRTSLSDVKIDSKTNGTITLGGRILDKSQLDELPRLFPDRKLNTASIRILNLENICSPMRHEPGRLGYDPFIPYTQQC